MDKLVLKFSAWLLTLSALSLLATFICIVLGILARELHWNIAGLDAYAGYSIAATLFFALPATLLGGEHIRVTVVLDRLGARARNWAEWWSLLAAAGLALYIMVFAVRLVWISWTTHDISTSADATPLWLPQIALALGSIVFFLSFLYLIRCRLRGESLKQQTELTSAD